MKAARRVLLVDDDATTLKVVSAMLKRLSFEVVAEADPVAALLTCQHPQTSFDLLLTDISMSAMNGVDLARMVRASKPSIRVLFISGDLAKCEWLRMNGYRCLAKPFSFDELDGALKDALTRHE